MSCSRQPPLDFPVESIGPWNTAAMPASGFAWAAITAPRDLSGAVS